MGRPFFFFTIAIDTAPMAHRAQSAPSSAAAPDEAGLPARISRSRVCAGDWMRLHVGDRVVERGGRHHLGRVEAIHWSSVVKSPLGQQLGPPSCRSAMSNAPGETSAGTAA
jgi:hypothetical protein